MNNLKKAFENGKAFIPFITAGDPDLETTEKLIYAMAENGADLIELGIPFSDPVAEGDTIQKADMRALSAGTTTDKIFGLVLKVREKCDVPIAFMTYANVVFGYGADIFFEKCKKCGICALILPDIPFEEKNEFAIQAKNNDVKLISFIAPTSHERIKMISKSAEGFIYCVSSLGVTGVRSNITTDINSMIKLAKSVTAIPCCVGFGISTPEQAKEISSYSDGVIVGSAIIKIIEKYGNDSIKYVSEYVKEMKESIK